MKRKNTIFTKVMFSVIALATLVAVFAIGEATVEVAAAEDRTLVWSDEFNGSSLDTSKWSYEIGTGSWGWGNNELEYYTDRQENVSVSNGTLKITARNEAYGGMNYTSGRIITKGKHSFQYGRMEARIALPNALGLWPAFWMLGDSGTWPQCGELDIMEAVNAENRTHGTAHWSSNGNHASYGVSTDSLGTFDTTQFHVYALDWTEDYLVWLVDDREYNRMYIGPNASDLEEFQQKFFFILNLAVGGQWPGYDVNNGALPKSMEVDYVRVYQNADEQGGGLSSIQGDDPTNLLVNQYFDYGIKGWSTYIGSDWMYANAKFDTSLEDGITVNMSSIGGWVGADTAWGVQLQQQNIKLLAGQSYRVGFDITSSSNKEIGVYVQDTNGNTLASKILNLGVYEEQIQYFDIPAQGSDTTVTLSFAMGVQGNDVVGSSCSLDIKKIRISKTNEFKVSTGTPVVPDTDSTNLISNPNFYNGLKGWNTYVGSDWLWASAVFSKISGGGVSIDMGSIGGFVSADSAYGVQLYQDGINLPGGQNYSLRFKVGTTNTKSITVVLNDLNTGNALFAQTIKVNGCVTQDVVLNLGNVSSSNAQLMFATGAQADDVAGSSNVVTIKELKLARTADIGGFIPSTATENPNNILQNATFKNGYNNWEAYNGSDWLWCSANFSAIATGGVQANLYGVGTWIGTDSEWGIQLNQLGVALPGNVQTRLTFDVESSFQKTITVSIEDIDGTVIARQAFALEVGSTRVELLVPAQAAKNVNLKLALGAQGADIPSSSGTLKFTNIEWLNSSIAPTQPSTNPGTTDPETPSNPGTTDPETPTNPGTTTPQYKYEAEDYANMNGIDTEACSEGTDNVGWIEANDWMDYDVNVAAGNYKLVLRYAGTAQAEVAFQKNGANLTTVALPATGGWQTWTNAESGTFALAGGAQTLRIYFTAGGCNLNYFELVAVGGTTNPETPTNPGTTQGKLTIASASSSTVVGANVAENAIDSDTNTRWESEFVDNANITFDLGSTKSVNKVVLNWEGAYGKAYYIQVSTDGSNYQTVYTQNNGNGGIETITFNAVDARYVRLQGVTRGTIWGYSLWEAEIHGGTSSGITVLPETPVVDVPLVAGKLTIAGATSSPVMGANVAENAIDGNDGTRWESEFVDIANLTLDLGSVKQITKVVLNWEGAYGKVYMVQVSTDGNTWKAVYTQNNGTGGIEQFGLNGVSARYVRLQGIERATQWGYSLWEMEVYNLNGK